MTLDISPATITMCDHKISAIDARLSPSDYRRALLGTLLERALTEALTRKRGMRDRA